MADRRREHDPEQELARELRAWRVDRVLLPMVLALLLAGAGTVEVVGWSAVPAVWEWAGLALLLLAVLRGGVVTIRGWGRRWWRGTSSSIVESRRASRVASDLEAGSVREEDRDLAARQLLTGRVVSRGQIWTFMPLGIYGFLANPEVFPLALRLAFVGLIGVSVVCGFRILETGTATATRFLDRPATNPERSRLTDGSTGWAGGGGDGR